MARAFPHAFAHAFKGLFTTAAAGAVGGIYGAAGMTVLRLAAQRAGLIDKMVPQVIEETLLGRRHRKPRASGIHEMANQLLHLGYGAAWGAVAGPVLAERRGAGLWPGGMFGLGLWAIGMALLLPRHRALTPGGWHLTPAAQLVNVAAHALFGAAVQLTVQEPVSGRANAGDGSRPGDGPRVG